MPTANFRLKIKLQDQHRLRVLYENVDKFNVRAKRDMPELTKVQAEFFQYVLREALQESGGGMTWSVPPWPKWWKHGTTKPSAAPGEMPVSQTGALKESVRVVPQARFNSAVEIGAGMERNYATLLEYGGWTSCFDNGPVAERPWVRPTWDEWQDRVKDVGRDYFIHRTWGAVW